MLKNYKNALLFLCLSCSPVQAISLLHPAAHIGASYTIHDISHRLVYRLTDNKNLSYLISIPLTFGIGVLYKYIEDGGTLRHTQPHSIIYNNIGISLSVFVIELDK